MPQIEKRIRPRTAIIAFPSFGLVGNIALEFLKEHLKTEKIGRLFMDEMVPLIVVHNNHFAEPISFYYNNRYRIVLIEGIHKIDGLENKISTKLVDFIKRYNIKNVITLDGVAGIGNGVYYYSKHKVEVLEKAWTIDYRIRIDTNGGSELFNLVDNSVFFCTPGKFWVQLFRLPE